MLTKLEKKLLYYMGKAVADYAMIGTGDRVMVCLSGGKDSYTLLYLLNLLRIRGNNRFEIAAYTLDQSQPGWNDKYMRAWLEQKGIPYTIEKRNTYAVVTEKTPEGKSFCSLCSRLRRGNIYRFAKENGFTKIALGHHRDDLIESLLMSIFYSGQIRSMPPKLLTDDGENIVIRPLTYCQEADIVRYANYREFPIIPCNLCGSQENLKRKQMKALIAELAMNNPKVPSNILGAIGNVQPSQLMDQQLWDFKSLKVDRDKAQVAQDGEVKDKGPAAVAAI